MKKVIYLYKPVGLTPLQIITIFREQYPEYAQITLGYAGRLDPMADGLLLVLVGDENKKRKIYEDLPKEYECDVLFGLETDTYDVLGKIINAQRRDAIYYVSTEHIKQTLPTFLGKQTQPYPPYSSQPVNGKPLYWWARNNKLADIKIPTKNIQIYSIELLSQKNISTTELQKTIANRIAQVTGDFRQKEIMELWNNFFQENNNQIFPVFRFRISCSSGTYIRAFAHNLGKQLQTNAIALGITRTKVGDYNLQDITKLDIL
ncbi:MAG TPA: hypothetical protein VLG12_03165 [Candidatus Saccharimonadales bacterium]|nr:hypothetical protein [Candidatus Saccharimonadales bacterium]